MRPGSNNELWSNSFLVGFTYLYDQAWTQMPSSFLHALQHLCSHLLFACTVNMISCSTNYQVLDISLLQKSRNSHFYDNGVNSSRFGIKSEKIGLQKVQLFTCNIHDSWRITKNWSKFLKNEILCSTKHTAPLSYSILLSYPLHHYIL